MIAFPGFFGKALAISREVSYNKRAEMQKVAGRGVRPTPHDPVMSANPTQHNRHFCLHRRPIIPVYFLYFKWAFVCCALIYQAVLSDLLLNTAFCISGGCLRGAFVLCAL